MLERFFLSFRAAVADARGIFFQWTQVPLAAKAFELLVQTVSREDRDEDDEGSFDSGGRDSDNSVNTLLRNLDVFLRDVCASGVLIAVTSILMSCPHFHSQVSGRLQGGDDDDLGGRAEKGLDEVEECSDKRPSGGDVLTGSEVLNHKPPFMGTEQFEARKKEMVKTLMAGIGIARDQDLDDDKLEDPLSRVRIRPAGVVAHLFLLFQFRSVIGPHWHARDVSD